MYPANEYKGPQNHIGFVAFCVIRLGFEPKTHSLEGCCSIQLSYRTEIAEGQSPSRGMGL